MLAVVRIQHAGRKIGDILTGVALAGNIDFVSLHAERLDKPLPEVVELVGDIKLVVDCRRSRREAGTSRLVNVDQVCQVRPGVRIRTRLVSSRLPEEGTVFL